MDIPGLSERVCFDITETVDSSSGGAIFKALWTDRANHVVALKVTSSFFDESLSMVVVRNALSQS